MVRGRLDQRRAMASHDLGYLHNCSRPDWDHPSAQVYVGARTIYANIVPREARCAMAAHHDNGM